eukprot:355716-Chlamydomonas_euryale.AAC.2
MRGRPPTTPHQRAMARWAPVAQPAPSASSSYSPQAAATRAHRAVPRPSGAVARPGAPPTPAVKRHVLRVTTPRQSRTADTGAAAAPARTAAPRRVQGTAAPPPAVRRRCRGAAPAAAALAASAAEEPAAPPPTWARAPPLRLRPWPLPQGLGSAQASGQRSTALPTCSGPQS